METSLNPNAYVVHHRLICCLIHLPPQTLGHHSRHVFLHSLFFFYNLFFQTQTLTIATPLNFLY